MKNAEITPIFKKKDDMDKENYRPISILAVFSQVFDIFNDMLCTYRKQSDVSMY